MEFRFVFNISDFTSVIICIQPKMASDIAESAYAVCQPDTTDILNSSVWADRRNCQPIGTVKKIGGASEIDTFSPVRQFQYLGYRRPIFIFSSRRCIKFFKFSGNQLLPKICNFAGSQVVSELYEYPRFIAVEIQFAHKQPAHNHLSNSFRLCGIVTALNCVASFADFEGQTAGIMDINLAVFHEDVASDHHVSSLDAQLLKTEYRITICRFVSEVISTVLHGESYTGIRVHNDPVVIIAIQAEIPMTGVNPARAVCYRQIALVEIADPQRTAFVVFTCVVQSGTNAG